jgi:hypothetical protein
LFKAPFEDETYCPTMEAVLQVISTLAALGAVYFAYGAVGETRALRREDRVARLLELVAEVGETGLEVARGASGENLLGVANLRFEAAVKATGESLPECEKLLALKWPRYNVDPEATATEADAMAAVEAALKEVAELLLRMRDAR